MRSQATERVMSEAAYFFAKATKDDGRADHAIMLKTLQDDITRKDMKPDSRI